MCFCQSNVTHMRGFLHIVKSRCWNVVYVFSVQYIYILIPALTNFPRKCPIGMFGSMRKTLNSLHINHLDTGFGVHEGACTPNGSTKMVIRPQTTDRESQVRLQEQQNDDDKRNTDTS